MPPRRLLAVAAALALLGTESVPAIAQPSTHHAKRNLTCPLGSYVCAVQPASYAMCRPNAMLEFYDPTLPQDKTGRPTAKAYVKANSLTSLNQSVYHLQGNADLVRADEHVQADTVDYNSDTSEYDARGRVHMQEAGQLIAADHVKGNTADSTGVADGHLRFQLLQSRGNGVADRATMDDISRSSYFVSSFSTCDVGHHVWEFRSKKITIDKDKGRGTARNVKFYYHHVPWLWLPYFGFPTDNRRESGFLAPDFSNTSRSGYVLSQPYYFNLAPNYDLTVTPRIYTRRGLVLEERFRYKTKRSSGLLGVEYNPRDTASNDSGSLYDTENHARYLVKFISTTRLWDSWTLNTNINRASDGSFLYDYGSDLYNSSIGTLPSSVYMNGYGKWWTASIGADVYQNINPFLNNSVMQYNRLPRALFNMAVPLSKWLEVGMNDEATVFRKADNVGGQREDIYPYIAGDFQGSAWFVKPRVGYRYTAYQLQPGYQDYDAYGVLSPGEQSPFTKATMQRSLPVVSLDSGLIFDRQTNLFGNDYTQTLEPRLYYLYVPYRNQNNLPLFDTGIDTVDYQQLFTTNQYSGADRQMNANNLTAAVTTRFLDDSGNERFSASVGQIQYFAPQLVTLPYEYSTAAGKVIQTNTTVTNWARSNYVFQGSLTLDDNWRVTSTYQYDPNTHRTDVAIMDLQHRFGGGGLINFSYLYRRGLLNQYSSSAVYPLSDRWRLLGSLTWSVVDHELIEALGGVEYDSCCVAFRVVDRSYVNTSSFSDVYTNNKRDNTFMFEVIFKGIGSSSNQIESMLRRDILGYQGYQ
ncbi:LPS-assembly protein LptD [Frateuria aurantia]